jgi:glycosyltransferase involved in cell wall biosynthesis
MPDATLEQSSVWVVVPAFNEGSRIGATIGELAETFANVVIVDDRSADATGDLALEAGAHVVRHPVNLGQGAALATGIAYALRNNANSIVTFDADGQHDVADARRMVDELVETGCDVVLGSRFLGASIGMRASRRLLLRAAILFTRFTTGLKVTDTHNGLRVLSATAARTITIRHNRMAHASEILGQIAAHGLSYREVPVTIRYTDYSRAKGQRWTGMFAILGDLFAGRLYR